MLLPANQTPYADEAEMRQKCCILQSGHAAASPPIGATVLYQSPCLARRTNILVSKGMRKDMGGEGGKGGGKG